MAQVASRYGTEIPFKTETPDQARRRARRQHAERIEAKAIELLEHDPEVSTMREARAKAREIDELDAQLQKGLIDPSSGAPTRKAKRIQREKSSTSSPPRGSSTTRGSTRAPSRGTRRAVRRSARAVSAPFGSAVSTGWTLASGGLGLVLLYVVLRDARVIGATIEGIGAGLRRVADPYTPLLPSSSEISRPPTPGRQRPRRRPRDDRRPQRDRNQEEDPIGGAA